MQIKINMPDIGDDEVEITEILVREGEKIITEQSLITVEGDKTSMEVPSPFSGTIKELKVRVGDKVSTGSLIMIFEVENEEKSIPSNEENAIYSTYSSDKAQINSDALKSESEFSPSKNETYVHATPLIRRLAYKYGINLEKVKGTGRKGRILREDIFTYLKDTVNHPEPNLIEGMNVCIPNTIPWPKSDFRRFGEVEEIELSRINRVSGSNLSRNWIMIPHVTHFDRTDITELESFRKQKNAELKKCYSDTKITLVPFIMKAVVYALEQMPKFNSSLSEDGQRLILKKYINIGLAVDTPKGLVVPVFKNINKKGIIDLSRELTIIIEKARDGKLSKEEMQGGCFTISSIGRLGTTHFSPIINAPEVAILGISKSSIEPVWNGEEFMPRVILPISLSFDHRVIDGADGARFITLISNLLKDIRCLVM